MNRFPKSQQLMSWLMTSRMKIVLTMTIRILWAKADTWESCVRRMRRKKYILEIGEMGEKVLGGERDTDTIDSWPTYILEIRRDGWKSCRRMAGSTRWQCWYVYIWDGRKFQDKDDAKTWSLWWLLLILKMVKSCRSRMKRRKLIYEILSVFTFSHCCNIRPELKTFFWIVFSSIGYCFLVIWSINPNLMCKRLFFFIFIKKYTKPFRYPSILPSWTNFRTVIWKRFTLMVLNFLPNSPFTQSLFRTICSWNLFYELAHCLLTQSVREHLGGEV